MDINDITKLIQAVTEYGLTSFEMEQSGLQIKMKREKAAPAVPMIGVVAAPTTAVAMTAPVVGTVQTAEVKIGSENVMTSPLVGTFYNASTPGSEPFVKAGDTVKKGQVLGIIEAMKLMNEIESEYDGVVEAVLVGNEEVVEYGQPLFRIK